MPIATNARPMQERLLVLGHRSLAGLTIALVLLGVGAARAGAQPATKKALPLPEVALHPFAAPGLAGREAHNLMPILSQAYAGLVPLVLRNPQTLQAYADQNQQPLTLNERRAASQVFVGIATSPADRQRTIQPVVCRIGDQLLFGVTLADLSNQLYLGIGLAALADAARQQVAGDQELTELILNRWQQAYRSAQDAARQSPARDLPGTDNLKLGLALAKNNNHQSRGSHLCRSLLLASRLAQSYKVQPILGHQHTVHIYRILAQNHQYQRATRQLTLEWRRLPSLAWPLTLPLAVRHDEAVFGAPIQQPLVLALAVQADGTGSPQFTLPEDLTGFLNQERQSLDLTAPARIIHIYGAWAYLDKGRAYGLRMTDRLIHTAPNLLIKGHVVGYFGPGAGLKDQQGTPIHEGAILYIRKGLRQLAKGQSFVMDPTNFPTAWPPQPTP